MAKITAQVARRTRLGFGRAIIPCVDNGSSVFYVALFLMVFGTD